MKVLLLAAAWVLLGAAAPPAPPDAGARAAAELRLRSLTAASDGGGLAALADDGAAPSAVRGRALLAEFERKTDPLGQADRVRLLKMLGDPAPELRMAALRVVGQRRERALENEALRLAAEDTDWRVRVEALRAVRPWGRQGHLYFLQQALGAGSPYVQAEALRSVGRLGYREVPPDILSYTQAATAPNQDTAVRLRALEALKAWGKLEWAELRDVLFEAQDSETLRLFAVQASDVGAPPDERGRLLLDILAGDPSERLAWEAFQRLRRGGGEDATLSQRVARYLTFSGSRNTATDDMAAYLRARGYRAEYRAGAWKVNRP